jgi:hypothetical protein
VEFGHADGQGVRLDSANQITAYSSSAMVRSNNEPSQPGCQVMGRVEFFSYEKTRSDRNPAQLGDEGHFKEAVEKKLPQTLGVFRHSSVYALEKGVAAQADYDVNIALLHWPD